MSPVERTQAGDPNRGPIYAGLSRARLEVEQYEIGHGVVLSRCFAHIFAPYMMAFALPPRPGAPHPAPWKSASGGFAFDIQTQIYAPIESFPDPWFDRLTTVWWIVALLRLRVSPAIVVPVVSDMSFSEASTATREPLFWPIEMQAGPLMVGSGGGPEASITSADLEWLRDHWIAAGTLMAKHKVFNRTFQSFDSARFSRSPSDALLVLWGALEQMFSRKDAELRFRVSAVISSYLEPIGEQRRKAFEHTRSLYDRRSKVAHGGTLEEADAAFKATRALLRQCLQKMISTGRVPPIEHLEANVLDNRLWAERAP